MWEINSIDTSTNAYNTSTEDGNLITHIQINPSEKVHVEKLKGHLLVSTIIYMLHLTTKQPPRILAHSPSLPIIDVLRSNGN